MTAQYVYLILFACAAYLIATDASVARLVVLLGQIARFQYEKYRWIALHHPRTPWARYSMWRRSNRLAKELMKELESRNK